MLAKLLRVKFWRLFFRIGIEGDPPEEPDGVEVNPDEGDPEADPEGEPEGGEPEGEPEGEPDGEAPPARKSASQTIRELKEERNREKEARERFERELAEARRSSAPVITEEQRLFQAEEAKLKDPNTSDLEKWQIQGNREIRAARNLGQNALAQAADLNDRTQFRELATKKPALFAKYEKRVEQELANLRAKGGNANRQWILATLIGKDAIEGEVKPAGKKTAKPAGQDVPRGRTPGARSDVSAKGNASEAEKRRKRLENVQI